MGEFLQALFNAFEFIWPFRKVEHWEGGGRYVFGRWWKPVGPGIYFVVPWFMDVKVASQAELIVVGERQDITLQDNSILSFKAAMTVKVVEPFLAINAVEEYKETARELMEAVLAEKLSEVDAQRLTPEKRKRLYSDLLRWVADEARPYGLEVTKVRFPTFVTNTKVYRIMADNRGFF